MAAKKKRPSKSDEALRARAEEGDDDARVVYGDALLELGDARGELIALQSQLEGLSLDEPRRLDLEIREALLLATHDAPWARNVGLRTRHAQSWTFEYRRGFLDAVELTRTRWRFADEIAAALGQGARSATRLGVVGDIDWGGLARIAAAMPRVTSLSCQGAHIRNTAGKPAELFDHEVVSRLTAIDLDVAYGGQREGEALARAVGATGRATGLRAVTLRGSAQLVPVLEAFATIASAPRIEAWTIDGYSFAGADVLRAISASGRRDGATPLRELSLDAQCLDDDLIGALGRDVPARYKSLRVRGQISFAAAIALAAAPAAAELESLEIAVPLPKGEPRPAPRAYCPCLRRLVVEGVTDAALASVVDALDAPALRSLRVELAQGETGSDGLARLFDAPWFAGVESLELFARAAHPWLGGVKRTTSNLRRLAGRISTEALAQITQWVGLSKLRSFGLHKPSDPGLDGDDLVRLVGSPALASVERVWLDLGEGALRAIERAPALPSLRLLAIEAMRPQREDIDALSRWAGSKGLHALEIDGRQTPPGMYGHAFRGVDVFPELQLVATNEDEYWLRERFGPAFLAGSLHKEASLFAWQPRLHRTFQPK